MKLEIPTDFAYQSEHTVHQYLFLIPLQDNTLLPQRPENSTARSIGTFCRKTEQYKLH